MTISKLWLRWQFSFSTSNQKNKTSSIQQTKSKLLKQGDNKEIKEMAYLHFKYESIIFYSVKNMVIIQFIPWLIILLLFIIQSTHKFFYFTITCWTKLIRLRRWISDGLSNFVLLNTSCDPLWLLSLISMQGWWKTGFSWIINSFYARE